MANMIHITRVKNGWRITLDPDGDVAGGNEYIATDATMLDVVARVTGIERECVGECGADPRDSTPHDTATDDDPPCAKEAWRTFVGPAGHSWEYVTQQLRRTKMAPFCAALRISNTAAIERARAKWEREMRVITRKQYQLATKAYLDCDSGWTKSFRVALGALNIRVEGDANG